MRGSIFDTLGRALLVLAPGPQQLAITAAHQREAALHQADGSVAQIVRFPGAIGDALLPNSASAIAAIRAAGAASIERAKGGAQSFTPLFG